MNVAQTHTHVSDEIIDYVAGKIFKNFHFFIDNNYHLHAVLFCLRWNKEILKLYKEVKYANTY